MNLRNSLLRGIAPVLTAVALAAMVTASAQAQTVTNGSFGTTGANTQIKGFSGDTGYGATLSGWTNVGGYDFLMKNAGPVNDSYGDTVTLDAPVTASPDGGNFVALDSDVGYNGTLTGTITGLTGGDAYTLSFYFAASQQTGAGYTAPTYDTLTATAGSTSQSYTLDDPTQGTTAWTLETLDFIATGSTESVSFSSIGGALQGNPNYPNNVPAFALLDGISVTPAPAPEPNSLILLGTGLAGLGGFVRSRFTKTAKSNA